MNIETAEKMINKYTSGHSKVITDAEKADRYYRNKTDILFDKDKKEDNETPLHNADNRVCSSFYSLLVNQKSSYIFTSPPLFDVGNTQSNEIVSNILGDMFAKRCKDLCINASNAGIAWVHYWIDDKNNFKYGVLDARQVIPIWSDDLEKRLLGVLRTYKKLDDDGNSFAVYELWNDSECSVYKREITDDEGYTFVPYNCFCINGKFESVYNHDFGRVPFIAFPNNNICTSDLESIKGLIDTYDKTYSGFANDLEDIQEIIFVLSGYGGTNLEGFLSDLKKYKTVKLDSADDLDLDGSGGSLSTLTIDIPVEAREKLLAMTRKAIFEQGQGVDPDPQKFGNTSGEALKYLYSLLELKAGLLETEFRSGFAELITAICNFKKIPCGSIIQTWTRTSISNDKELAEIIQKSSGVISNRTLVERHPLVENADEELKRLKEERDEPVLEEEKAMFGGE